MNVGSERKRLILDTDWISALGVALFLVACLCLAVWTFVEVVDGIPPSSRVTWETWFLAGYFIYLLLATTDRSLRFAIGLAAAGAISRVMLWSLRASMAVQIGNAAIFRVFEMFLYLGGCIFAGRWFFAKLHRKQA